MYHPDFPIRMAACDSMEEFTDQVKEGDTILVGDSPVHVNSLRYEIGRAHV